MNNLREQKSSCKASQVREGTGCDGTQLWLEYNVRCLSSRLLSQPLPVNILRFIALVLGVVSAVRVDHVDVFRLQLEGTGIIKPFRWTEAGHIFQYILEHIRVEQLVTQTSRKIRERKRLEAQHMRDVTADIFPHHGIAVTNSREGCPISQQDDQQVDKFLSNINNLRLFPVGTRDVVPCHPIRHPKPIRHRGQNPTGVTSHHGSLKKKDVTIVRKVTG